MTLLTRITALAALLILPSVAMANDPKVIGWSDLAGPPVEMANPFAELSRAQLDQLRLLLRHELGRDHTEEEIATAQELRADLERQDIDVDALFQARLDIIAARADAATTVNEDLVGDTIRMPGYLLPLRLDGRRATEFLLVATYGACIHTPPPPPNQVVHVVYEDGIEVQGLFTPVWITGVLNAQFSQRDVVYSDGQAPVSISYQMQADTVAKFE